MSELWDAIDLGRHGVIEAHAGTGKTYTIVKLVLRILETTVIAAEGREQPIHIRELLLVTFTEKAAGELKKRIREGIEERIGTLPAGDGIRAHLENCLNNLHEALIGTIHAVCLRLLQTWPFESGIHFDTEIVDDAEGLESALRESMRTDWQDENTGIPWALRKIAETGGRIEQEHFDLIVKTAKELLDGEYTELDRGSVGGADLAQVRRLIEDGAPGCADNETLKDFFDQINGCIATMEAIIADHRSLFNDEMRSEFRGRIDLWKTRVAAMRPTPSDFQGLKKYGGNRPFATKTTKQHPLFERLAGFHESLPKHLFLKMAEGGTIPLTLICDAAELLARRWKRIKQEHGFISYQDMLQQMHTAVTERPVFADSLRKKLRYAIIDEFQDTSRLQWEVFNSLFLKNDTEPSPRLYIVGDPKQSIYSFQGADVRSYLDARTAIRGTGNTEYKLTSNFRSLDAIIKGYNAIFTSKAGEQGWFLNDDEIGGITYRTENAVTPPGRSPAAHPVLFPPVQVMPLSGAATQRRTMMAEYTGRAIQRLIGAGISIPCGPGWKDITVNYEHIAVIVETHKLADPFLEAFREKRIPAVKYKMEGVFQSPMARALHALLKAILSPSGDPAPRLAALLTPFFNRRPEAIDPEHDLEPCGNPRCCGDALCITHALQEWTGLAGGSYWSQLFESIQRRTGIGERLIRLNDGERHIADFRQVVDYCIELFYCRNYTLVRLAEHLGSLLEEEISAGQDRNLHVLETQKSSVKVLTMHAAKGLEFPVVFVVTGSSKSVWNGPGFIRFTDAGFSETRGVHSIKIAPYLSKEDIRSKKSGRTPEQCFLDQANQERRRLLYVALTRAQAILFVPMHLEELPEAVSGSVKWTGCKPGSGVDNDLTPKLMELLDAASDNPSITLFDAEKLPVAAGDGVAATSDSSRTPVAGKYPDIGSLKLLSRVCRQTSYSQLSREMPSVREIDRSEEVDDGDNDATARTPSPLPGGKETGDALHRAIEEILGDDDVPRLIENEIEIAEAVEKYLERNGIPARIRRVTASESAVNDAIAVARNCVRGALTTAITLPNGSALNGVASLAKADRLAEMEFLLQVGRHWAHGYMDLVFRIGNPCGGDHPWRYFLLDWKSDTLTAFDHATIEQCIRERHYDLQARLYSHALDEYLHGILGSTYDPAQHLGGAVYLFLREHEKGPLESASVWTYTASPQEDKKYMADKVTAWDV